MGLKDRVQWWRVFSAKSVVKTVHILLGTLVPVGHEADISAVTAIFSAERGWCLSPVFQIATAPLKLEHKTKLICCLGSGGYCPCVSGCPKNHLLNGLQT